LNLVSWGEELEFFNLGPLIKEFHKLDSNQAWQELSGYNTISTKV
jgi:hypothetical protein